MGFFYTTDDLVDPTSYWLFISCAVTIPITYILCQVYTFRNRNDDFMKYRFYISNMVVLWAIYASLLENLLTSDIIADYISVCVLTHTRFKISAISIRVSLNIVLANTIQFTFISFRQYWSEKGVSRNSGKNLMERIVEWMISRYQTIKWFQSIFFIIPTTIEMIIGTNCTGGDVTSNVTNGLCISLIIFLALYIRGYGSKDRFHIRRELLRTMIYGSLLALFAFITILIVGDITAKSGNSAVFYMLVLGGICLNVYYEPIIYTYKKARGILPAHKIKQSQIIKKAKKIDNIEQSQISIAHSVKPITFEMMMETKILKNAFRKFLISEFSCENLMFIEDALAYQNATEHIGSQIEQATHIYKTYIAEGSSMQVNISAIQRSNIDNIFISVFPQPTRTVFHEAIREIKNLINNDSWGRFLVSKEALSAWQELSYIQGEHKEERPKIQGWFKPSIGIKTLDQIVDDKKVEVVMAQQLVCVSP